MEKFLRIVVVPITAVVVALLIGLIFLAVTGYPTISTYRAIIHESFADWYGFGQVLRTTTLLIFTGLAVAVAFRAGLFNIGVEGQLYIGAMAVGIAGFYINQLPKHMIVHLPHWAWIFGLTLIAMAGGALWAGIPGVLKAFTGAHEVITTIMMNFIAYGLIIFLLRPSENSFAVAGTTHTPAFPRSLRLSKLGKFFTEFQASTVNTALFLALAAAVIIWLILRFTKLGYEIRAVGQNPLASQLGGISPRRITISAMCLSGALAGLVGVEYVLGYKGYFEEGFSAGLGFLGIAVALLAANHPLAVIPTAFLFGVLNYGKVAAGGTVPKDIIAIMEAGIIFSVIIGNKLFAGVMLNLQKRRAAAD